MLRKIDWESQIGRRFRFRDLYVFFTVAQLGSMARAAAQLGVSPPTISEVIADLEHGLGVQLLDRSPRGVEPTAYGAAILKRGLAAFDELRQGIKDIEFLADPTSGELRIGCPEAIAAILPPILEDFSLGIRAWSCWWIKSVPPRSNYRDCGTENSIWSSDG
jgi:DNA-binding transcriptional LysR family regulator